MKLRVKFWRIGNVLAMQVLEMAEGLRGAGVLALGEGYAVKSASTVGISGCGISLFVRGTVLTHDDLIAAYEYRNSAEAVRAELNFAKLIRQINEEAESHTIAGTEVVSEIVPA